MGRTRAKIRYDDARRTLKAVIDLRLPIAQVVFDGERLVVNIGEAGTAGTAATGPGEDAEEVDRL